MKKKLVRHGNSRALVLDKTLLELLGIGEEETEVTLSVVDHSLLVRRASAEEQDAAFERATRDSLAKYGDVYKRLAE